MELATAAATSELEKSQNQFPFADRAWIYGFLLRSPLCILGSFQALLGPDLVLSWALVSAGHKPLSSTDRNFLYSASLLQSFFLS